MPADRNLQRLALILQHDLLDLEQGDDRQLGHAARFLGQLCDIQIESKLPVMQFDDAIRAAVDGINLRASARSANVELHTRLTELAGRVGFQVRNEGGYPRPTLTPAGAGHPSAYKPLQHNDDPTVPA